MSSRNRRNRGEQNDPFNLPGTEIGDTQLPSKAPSMREVDHKGYGSPPILEVKQETVKAIALNKIIPDPSQPRRAIPFAVRPEWDGNIETLFPTWEGMIQEQENEAFSIHSMLAGGDESRNPEPKPLETALMKIIDLAITIQRDGLANPITCVLHGADTFYLETGERRLLAYHLLLWATGDPQWKSIPVRRVEQWSVWHQASENNVRDNLNAISKARQLALLVMDLLAQKGHKFQAFKDFEYEQDFYAQVADGETYGLPKGTSEQILSAMGVTNRSVITHYRNLLELPRVVWLIADDLNWTERKLRLLTALSEDEAIYRASKWAKDEGYVLTMVNTNIEAPLNNTAETNKKDDIGDLVIFLEKSKANIALKLKKVDRLQALELIEQYEEWVKDLKRGLQQN